MPAGRRMFEEGWIGGTGRLRRPSKPTYQDDSLAARTEKGFFKLGGMGVGGNVVLSETQKPSQRPLFYPCWNWSNWGNVICLY